MVYEVIGHLCLSILYLLTKDFTLMIPKLSDMSNVLN